MSSTGFQTTHTGSLPRPASVAERVFAAAERGAWQPDDGPALQEAVREIVARQHDIGLSTVNDGEITRLRYWDVFTTRMDGIEPFADEIEMVLPSGRFAGFAFPLLEVDDYPVPPAKIGLMPRITGPVAYRGPLGLEAELERLRSALGDAPGFMTAPAPGMLTDCRDEYYGDVEELLAASAQALAGEYRAILDSGLQLQIDSPDLPSAWNGSAGSQSRRLGALHLDALRQALRGLPAEQIRLHVCWGNAEAPHDDDVELREFIAPLLEMPVGALVLEAANPRHAHEWRLWKDLDLGDKRLIVGVIDTTTNFVEHPELVADRICQYADLVGPERVIAGTDCGFGTWAHFFRVDPRIAWAKLETLVEGARLASQRVYGMAA